MTRKLIPALLFLLSLGVEAATYTVTQTTVPRQSNGRIDRAYPDGNDSAPLVWGTCPNQQFTVGDSCAVNLRTVCSLTGTNSSTATLAKVSGTLPAGCSEGTNGLTGTVSGAQASNQVVWQATDGVTSVTTPFTIEAVAAPAGDTTAPTIPTGCTFTPGTGTITVECDQSSDPYVSEAGSGVAWYRIYKDGVLVASKAAPSPNIQQSLAAMTVGSADGTQSATQTGANRAMSGGGAGLGSTTDQLYGVGYQVTGDFIATAKVGSFAGSVTTGTAGLMARVSNAVGSIYGTCRARDSDDKVNNRYRATLDGSASNTALTAAFTFPVYLKMAVESNALTCYTSTDGLSYTATAAATPLSLGTQPYVLAFHASGTAATNTTSAIDQINIAPVTRWSQSVSTTSSGSWTVKAEDGDGNLSAATTAVTSAPEQVACTGSSNITTLHADDFEYGQDGDEIDESAEGVFDSTKRWRRNVDASAAGGPTTKISTLKARNGTRSARNVLNFHNGSTWYTAGGCTSTTDPAGGTTTSAACTAYKNEIIVQASTADGYPNVTQALGGDYWYGVSVYVVGASDADGDPEWFPTVNSPPARPTYSFWIQSHQSAWGPGCTSPSGNPTFSIGAFSRGADGSGPRDTVETWLISDINDCPTDGTSTTTRAYPGLTTAFKGAWTDYIIHWRVAVDNTGVFEMWKKTQGTDSDYVKFFERVGAPTTRNNPLPGNDMRLTSYTDPLSSAASIPAWFPQSRVVYFDDWQMVQVTGNPVAASDTSSCAFREVAP